MKTLIDFEDLSKHQFFTDHYKSKGIVFPGIAYEDEEPGIAHSGTKYIVPWRQEFQVFDYMYASLTPVRQKRLSLYAGTIQTAGLIIGVLRAFGKNGVEVVHDGPRTIQPGVCATRFEVAAAGNQIASVVMEMYGFDANGVAFDPDQAIDDIEFEADFPPLNRAASVPIEPPIFDPWWWIKTRGGLVPPGPTPWSEWQRPFLAALALANAAQHVGEMHRSSATELAAKQGAFALKALKEHIKAPGHR